jgi:hypothetical protein
LLEVLRLGGVVAQNAHPAVPPVRRLLLPLTAGGGLGRDLPVVLMVKLVDQRNLDLVLASLRAVIVVGLPGVLLR